MEGQIVLYGLWSVFVPAIAVLLAIAIVAFAIGMWKEKKWKK
jgi:hypothetical protein